MQNRLQIFDDELAEILEEVQYAEDGDIGVNHHINYETKQIFVEVFLDNTLDRYKGDDLTELKKRLTNINEVFSVSKFKIEVDIYLSPTTYYRTKELVSLVGAVRTYIRKQSKKAVKEEF